MSNSQALRGNVDVLLTRYPSLAVKEMENEPAWWWLSFSGGGMFLGVVIVFAHGLLEAVRICQVRNMNPGGEVLGAPMTLEEVPLEKYRNKILSEELARECMPTRVKLTVHNDDSVEPLQQTGGEESSQVTANPSELTTEESQVNPKKSFIVTLPTYKKTNRARKTKKDKVFDEANNKGLRECEAMHQAIIKNMVSGYAPPADRKPIAYVLGGGTAAGKTIFTLKYAVRIDADELKLAISAYQAFRNTDPDGAAARLHEESKAIARKLLAEVIDRGLDYTYDSTTDGGALMMRGILSHKYDVKIIFVDVPITVAIKRVVQRAAQSGEVSDYERLVPPEVIKNCHHGSAKRFFEIKDLSGISSVRLYDTSGSKDGND